LTLFYASDYRGKAYVLPVEVYMFWSDFLCVGELHFS